MSDKIQVKVDKSHLFTLGEKMYRESIEFIRELVSNAYDADATEVYINVSDNQIVIEDNGSGMNERGLSQFFTIGSEEKKLRNTSTRFGRRKIGQFGIGKFSALAIADQFIVESVRGNYKYSVVFDRSDWNSNNEWELPIKKEAKSPFDHEGTRMILNRLYKKISISETEKYLKQSVPLRAKKFKIFLNNKRITAKTVPGRIIPIKVDTMYGEIRGQIVIAINPRDVSEPGLECQVKQVFIKRSLFGIDKKYHQGTNKITGNVNADFLPLISSRSDFVLDSSEYKLFHQIIYKKLDEVIAEIKKQSETKNLNKITKELQDVMRHIRDALVMNPDFIPQGKAISRLKKEARKKMALASEDFKKEKDDFGDEKNNEEVDKKEQLGEDEKKDKEKEPEEEKKIDVKPLVMKKIRLKKLGISCGIVDLGEDGPEVISQGNMVYVNQNHPLYQKVYKKKDMLMMHLIRLITQEIVLMKKLRITAKEAFDWQAKLIRDAMCV